ncbi:MAG: PQQ-binding-like beta-propeller repeat protein [Capsulimonadaceae bacterium]|nr:PQQ-binding-like beta-propeller repeat protein [Capsulimonadaceae bacterium]
MRTPAISLMIALLATIVASPVCPSHADPGAPSASQTLAHDWPAFRGPDANGISPETGINKNWAARPPKMLWTQPMTDEGYAGPSEKDGAVFIVDHLGTDDIVRSFDLTTGAEKWRYTYPDAATSNYGFTRATPSVDGHRVYIYSRLGRLICLTAATGKLVWQRDIIGEFHGRRPGWDMADSPLIDGNRVVVYGGGPDASVVVVDKTTGATIWSGGGSEMPGYSTPVLATIGGVKQYVCMLFASVEGVDWQTGRLLWSYPWKTGANVNAATPLVIGDSVFIASGYGHGCAMLDITGGAPQLRWQNTEIVAHFSSPIYAGGYIYGTGDPGFLSCLDPATGAALWKQRGFQKGGLIGIDGTIVAFNGAAGDLIMVALAPDAYKELGRFIPLGGQSWTAPIVANGKLIVRNKTTLAAFDLR